MTFYPPQIKELKVLVKLNVLKSRERKAHVIHKSFFYFDLKFFIFSDIGRVYPLNMRIAHGMRVTGYLCTSSGVKGIDFIHV